MGFRDHLVELWRAELGGNPSSIELGENLSAARASRMTTLSPYRVGTVAMRRSTSLPARRILMRPSCGRRRSAMLSWARILSAK